MEDKKPPRAPQAGEKYIVRFPDGMRERIAESAKESGRSMNAEIVRRIEDSFKPGEPGSQAISDLLPSNLLENLIAGAAAEGISLQEELIQRLTTYQRWLGSEEAVARFYESALVAVLRNATLEKFMDLKAKADAEPFVGDVLTPPEKPKKPRRKPSVV